MAKDMKPGETRILRYWKANQHPPSGWDNIALIGPHLPQGKVIVKVCTDE